LLYAVNAGSANISGFRIGENGTLTHITGSDHSLSSASAVAAQISFTPDGDYLLVTEKATNRITTFPVNASGVAAAASSSVAAGATPFGLSFAGAYMILTEAATDPAAAAVMTSYSNGSPTNMGGSSLLDQSAASWPVVTSDGQWVFITNTLGNAISSFSVDGNGSMSLVTSQATTAVGPSNLTLSANGSNLYVINIASRSISSYKRRNNGSLQLTGEVTGLPAGVVGIVAL
jgi:6-phosphogluconolactonase (cycloisomerase 2 family)